ncbi:hypothetical protein [Psychroserpens jangbogonensis]|uniref:hypothetical protein n=1 Tax=Psychroserpens jangbogonensis TaxID=1484460 RepID=UPI00053D83AE|nr:hypothetical protein [Psychroserpens jangbogonensis]
MKKITVILICLIFSASLQNCSSVKVLDSWKSENISNTKENNFLVVVRTDNEQARITFENEIVKQMKEKGFKATASFSKFGSLKPNEPKSEGSKQKLQELLKSQGFDGVVLTVMKDYQEETRVDKEGGYYAGGNYYGYYPRYYGGFYGYYYNPISYHTLGNYVPETMTTSTSKLYILETTVYDLKKTDENQLVAVVTSQLDNPESAGLVATDFVKKIAASLK